MSYNKRVFVAGAGGVIGRTLCKMMIKDGWEVYGTTRSEDKVAMLEDIGVRAIVVDVYDSQKLEEIVVQIKPDVVMHQLTDLPAGLDPDKMEEALVSNAKLREIGTKNLVNASTKAGVKKMIAQSIAFVYEPGTLPYTEESALLNFEDPAYGTTSKAVASLEGQVLDAPFIGIVLRNGLLYGEGTGFDEPIEYLPPVHVDAAAYAAFLAINSEKSGIYNITDEDARVSIQKAKDELKWSPEYRVH